MKKYEFTGEERVVSFYGGRKTVKRIRALIDIPLHDIEEGDLGGWIENESCLSHEGSCWLKDCSAVYDDGVIKGDILLDSGFSDMPGDEKPIYTRVQKSTISGEGFIEDSIVQNSYILGSNVYLRDAKVYHSRLNGNLNIINGEVNRVLISQAGQGAISIRQSHILAKKGFLRIQNVNGEELLLSEVSFEVFPYNTDHDIIGKGKISHLTGEIQSLNIYGEFDIKHVTLKKSNLLTSEKNRKLTLMGSASEPIQIMETDLLLHDAFISGSGIRLSGKISIFDSCLCDSVKITNESESVLEIKKVNMKDCSQIKKTNETTQNVLTGIELMNDDFLVI